MEKKPQKDFKLKNITEETNILKFSPVNVKLFSQKLFVV